MGRDDAFVLGALLIERRGAQPTAEELEQLLAPRPELRAKHGADRRGPRNAGHLIVKAHDNAPHARAAPVVRQARACPVDLGVRWIEAKKANTGNAPATTHRLKIKLEVAIDETGPDRRGRSKIDIVPAWMQSVP